MNLGETPLMETPISLGSRTSNWFGFCYSATAPFLMTEEFRAKPNDAKKNWHHQWLRSLQVESRARELWYDFMAKLLDFVWSPPWHSAWCVAHCGTNNICKWKAKCAARSEHCWQFRCRKSARCCGAKQISKSNVLKSDTWTTFGHLDVITCDSL